MTWKLVWGFQFLEAGLDNNFIKLFWGKNVYFWLLRHDNLVRWPEICHGEGKLLAFWFHTVLQLSERRWPLAASPRKAEILHLIMRFSPQPVTSGPSSPDRVCTGTSTALGILPSLATGESFTAVPHAVSVPLSNIWVRQQLSICWSCSRPLQCIR